MTALAELDRIAALYYRATQRDSMEPNLHRKIAMMNDAKDELVRLTPAMVAALRAAIAMRSFLQMGRDPRSPQVMALTKFDAAIAAIAGDAGG